MGILARPTADYIRELEEDEARAANDHANSNAVPPDDYEPSDDDAPDAPPVGHAEPAPPRKGTIEIVDSSGIFAPLEEPDWLIDCVIRRGSLVELVGYGSSGKSWIAIDALLAVASGSKWLGRFATKQGGALALDWENGLYEMRRRIQGVAKARQVWDLPALNVASMPSVYMTDPQFGRVVEDLAKDRALVVIDTLKAASPGIDENDSSIRGGLDALRRVGEKTGCAFLVLVHSKKVSGSLTALDAREAGRGSSAIFDAADSVLHITYAAGEPLRVQQTKSRQGRQIDPFLVRIEDGDGGAVSVTAGDAEQASAGPTAREKFFEISNRMLVLIKGHPGASGRILRAQLDGVRDSVCLAALELLEANGAIRNAGTKGGAKWFPTGRPAHPPMAPEADEWDGVADN